jgi:hypothetical protein
MCMCLHSSTWEPTFHIYSCMSNIWIFNTGVGPGKP